MGEQRIKGFAKHGALRKAVLCSSSAFAHGINIYCRAQYLSMNALVVYDSQFGNTEKIAKKIAGALEKSAKAVRVSEANPSMLKGISLLVVGCPTQRWRATPAIRSFLESLPDLSGVSAAAFDTRFKRTWLFTGSAARGIAKALKNKGAKLALEPESFFVSGIEGPLLDGEAERAGMWARNLIVH